MTPSCLPALPQTRAQHEPSFWSLVPIPWSLQKRLPRRQKAPVTNHVFPIQRIGHRQRPELRPQQHPLQRPPFFASALATSAALPIVCSRG